MKATKKVLVVGDIPDKEIRKALDEIENIDADMIVVGDKPLDPDQLLDLMIEEGIIADNSEHEPDADEHNEENSCLYSNEDESDLLEEEDEDEDSNMIEDDEIIELVEGIAQEFDKMVRTREYIHCMRDLPNCPEHILSINHILSSLSMMSGQLESMKSVLAPYPQMMEAATLARIEELLTRITPIYRMMKLKVEMINELNERWNNDLC